MASPPIRALLLCPAVHSMAQLDELLMEAGITQLDIARDTREAQAHIHALAVENSPPHALIIGICDTPPGCQALYIYQQLQQLQAINVFSALLLFSADASNEMVNVSRELQVDEFIVTPYQRPALLTRLGRLVSRFQASVELGLNMYADSDVSGWHHNLAVLGIAIDQQTNVACYTHWLKLKGIGLTRTGQWHQADKFYRQVLSQHAFIWAAAGSVACNLALKQFVQAEKQLLSLSVQPPFALTAYSLMADMYVQQHDYEAALEATYLLGDISPLTLAHHYQAVILARLCGDYAVAAQAAERFVVFAERTGQLKIQILLLAARTCIDENEQVEPSRDTQPLARAQRWLERTVDAFPSCQLTMAYRATRARLQLARGDSTAARAFKNDACSGSWNTEDKVELAKTLHAAGYQAHAVQLLAAAETQSKNALLEAWVDRHLALLQMTDKNTGQLHQDAHRAMDQRDYAQAMTLLQQAQQVTPKCARTAIALLQATLAQLQYHRNRSNLRHQHVRLLVRQCQQVVESTELSKEQAAEYQHVQLAVNQMFS